MTTIVEPTPSTPPAAKKIPRRLPVVLAPDEVLSSMGSDGHRRFVYAAEVKGRFATVRKVVFAALFAILLTLPLARIGGQPVLLLDVVHRHFYLFGATYNAQDAWLMFFIITGFVFLLALVTSLWGRVWCGFTCPQTVFLDGLYRPIERLVEGPREKRMRRDQGPWTMEKVARKLVKHALFLGASFIVAHIALSFFVPLPETVKMVMGSPSAHPEAFAWATSLTLISYGNFAWFREQLCLVVCPYGRLQGALVDDDSLVVGYDQKRGEPRGKVKDEHRGACVDCRRCIAVCPTGIDIRNGLQLDCVGCTACIDACDEIMDKTGQPRGLVRFDSKNGFSGEKKRVLRPRLAIYAVLGTIGLVAATVAFTSHKSFESTLVRQKGAPYVIEDGKVRNTFLLHVVNKSTETHQYAFRKVGVATVDVSLPETLELGAMETRTFPIVIELPSDSFKKTNFQVEVEDLVAHEKRIVRGDMVGPIQ